MNFIPHSRRPVEPAYTDALAETRAALASTYERLINCSSRRLPGRAVGSLCELQRATDHLQLATTAPNGRAYHDLLEALLQCAALHRQHAAEDEEEYNSREPGDHKARRPQR